MGVRVFKAAQNVNVVGKADFSYDKGASAVSSLLHAASVLLRLSGSWDWFVNLSPSHYPLVTQDGNFFVSVLLEGLLSSLLLKTSNLLHCVYPTLHVVLADHGNYM